MLDLRSLWLCLKVTLLRFCFIVCSSLRASARLLGCLRLSLVLELKRNSTRQADIFFIFSVFRSVCFLYLSVLRRFAIAIDRYSGMFRFRPFVACFLFSDLHLGYIFVNTSSLLSCHPSMTLSFASPVNSVETLPLQHCLQCSSSIPSRSIFADKILLSYF